VTTGPEDLHDFTEGRVGIDRDHIGTRHHGVRNALFAHFPNVSEQSTLLGIVFSTAGR